MNNFEELKFNLEALLHAVKEDMDFFSPIYKFVENLSVMVSDRSAEAKKEDIQFLAQKIEEFFKKWRGSGLYMPPTQISKNDQTVKEIFRLANKIASLSDDEFDKLKPSGKRPETAHQERLNDTNRIFIVHGRDEAAKSSVARFLEKLELKPVILHEQPNQGRTIIEKISDYSDVAFAVVLLTADDKGGLISCSSEELQLRARQNVIFELGYFIGKLERHRVCVLYKKGVEIPSDYKGVLFIPLDDADVWKSLLVKEMKESGIAIDMNKAI